VERETRGDGGVVVAEESNQNKKDGKDDDFDRRVKETAQSIKINKQPCGTVSRLARPLRVLGCCFRESSSRTELRFGLCFTVRCTYYVSTAQHRILCAHVPKFKVARRAWSARALHAVQEVYIRKDNNITVSIDYVVPLHTQ